MMECALQCVLSRLDVLGHVPSHAIVFASSSSPIRKAVPAELVVVDVACFACALQLVQEDEDQGSGPENGARPNQGNGDAGDFRLLQEEELVARYHSAYMSSLSTLREVMQDAADAPLRPLAERAMDLSEYGERLLPYIIGTPNYIQDDDCGLLVSDSEIDDEDEEFKVGARAEGLLPSCPFVA